MVQQNSAIKNQLNWILLLRIILYTALLGIQYFLKEENAITLPPPVTAFFLLIIYSFTILSAIQLQFRNSKISHIAFLQIIVDNLLATFFVYATGGSASIYTSVFFFPIISGGLLLTGVRGLSQAAASTALFAIIITLEFNAILPQYLQGQARENLQNFSVVIQAFTTQGLLFFLVGFFSFLLGSRLQKAEFALASSRKEYLKLSQLHKHIFDNISSGIIAIKPDHTISGVNQAGLNILHMTKEDLIGAPFSTAFPQIDLLTSHEHTKVLHSVKGEDRLLGYSTAILHESESRKASDLQGQHQVIVFKDITDQEKLEKQLHQAEKLAAIGTMSASIAHDFRNPLTAALGCTQILIDDVQNDDINKESQLELLRIIEQESKRLLTTISNFLFFARPNSPQRSWFSINQCIEDACTSCYKNPQWPTSCTVQVVVDGIIDIYADREQLLTVHTHLLENAVVFCEKGAEHIIISITDENNNKQDEGVEIRIEDNGKGIPAEDFSKVFEPFYTKRADGTGLGLSIVQQYVSANGGRISVKTSSLGGACFTIWLPFPQTT